MISPTGVRKEIELKESHEELTVVTGSLRHRKMPLKHSWKINKLAYTDLLTDCPTRSAWPKDSRRRWRKAMTVLLDNRRSDDFKLVNETYGHRLETGFLPRWPKGLSSDQRKRCSFARLGADEYAILAWDYEDEGSVPPCAGIEDRVDGYIHLKEANISISASIGITLYPQDAKSFDELTRMRKWPCTRPRTKDANTFL